MSVVYFDNNAISEEGVFAHRSDITAGCSIMPANSTDVIKSELASQIVDLLDRRSLTVRSAGVLTSTAAADFSRIRQGKLARFTVDRLIAILTRLDTSVEVSVQVSQRSAKRRASKEDKT